MGCIVDFGPLGFGEDGGERMAFGHVLELVALGSFRGVVFKPVPDKMDERRRGCGVGYSGFGGVVSCRRDKARIRGPLLRVSVVVVLLCLRLGTGRCFR